MADFRNGRFAPASPPARGATAHQADSASGIGSLSTAYPVLRRVGRIEPIRLGGIYRQLLQRFYI